jgi:DNA processing protein
VVVEANMTSGALITANMAVDAGRQVFAVPGRIDSPRSKGCHELLKKGAKLCETVEDIVTEFEYLFPRSNRGGWEGEAGGEVNLGEDERRILEVMGDGGEIGMDEVTRLTGLTSSAVAVGLLGLEMKRLVRQLPGKLFLRR